MPSLEDDGRPHQTELLPARVRRGRETTSCGHSQDDPTEPPTRAAPSSEEKLTFRGRCLGLRPVGQLEAHCRLVEAPLRLGGSPWRKRLLPDMPSPRRLLTGHTAARAQRHPPPSHGFRVKRSLIERLSWPQRPSDCETDGESRTQQRTLPGTGACGRGTKAVTLIFKIRICPQLCFQPIYTSLNLRADKATHTATTSLFRWGPSSDRGGRRSRTLTGPARGPSPAQRPRKRNSQRKKVSYS